MSKNKLKVENIINFDAEVSAVSSSDVINILTSTETQKPLSANMGKNLQDSKIDKILGGTAGNLVVQTSSGQLSDSGISTQLTEFFSGFLEAPAVRSYPLVVKLPYDISIVELYVEISSGSLSLQMTKNSSSNLMASSLLVNESHTVTSFSISALSAGDSLELVLTGLNSPIDLSYVIKYTRNLG